MPPRTGGTAPMMGAKSISANNKGQAGIYNSPEDRGKQVSPTATTGDRRWKRTQEWTGPQNNNFVSEGPEGTMESSRAGSTVLTTTASNTGGKKWTPDTTPDKREKKGPCPRMTGGNTRKEDS